MPRPLDALASAPFSSNSARPVLALKLEIRVATSPAISSLDGLRGRRRRIATIRIQPRPGAMPSSKGQATDCSPRRDHFPSARWGGVAVPEADGGTGSRVSVEPASCVTSSPLVCPDVESRPSVDVLLGTRGSRASRAATWPLETNSAGCANKCGGAGSGGGLAVRPLSGCWLSGSLPVGHGGLQVAS